MTALERRTALVTGAASGIGLAVTRRLVADGWRVIATRQPAEDATELARLPATRIAPVDLLDAGSVEGLIAEVRSEPGLDALVSNAGIAIPGPIEGMPLERLREQFEVNTFAPMRLTQALLPQLRARGGRLVFVGAGQGRAALPFGGPYAASKAALSALADALRAEVSGSGVSVSVIEPGAVRTGILASSRAAAARVLDAMPPGSAALYRDRLASVFERSTRAFEAAREPEELAALIARVLDARTPRPRYLFGRDARALAAVALLPATVRARLTARLGRRTG